VPLSVLLCSSCWYYSAVIRDGGSGNQKAKPILHVTWGACVDHTFIPPCLSVYIKLREGGYKLFTQPDQLDMCADNSTLHPCPAWHVM
jgi:hypothetical protein